MEITYKNTYFSVSDQLQSQWKQVSFHATLNNPNPNFKFFSMYNYPIKNINICTEMTDKLFLKPTGKSVVSLTGYCSGCTFCHANKNELSVQKHKVLRRNFTFTWYNCRLLQLVPFPQTTALYGRLNKERSDCSRSPIYTPQWLQE